MTLLTVVKLLKVKPTYKILWSIVEKRSFIPQAYSKDDKCSIIAVRIREDEGEILSRKSKKILSKDPQL